MTERPELNDHLLDLAKLANQRYITNRVYIVYPIMAVGAGLIRSLLPDGVYGDGFRTTLSLFTVGGSIMTGLLLGVDLIKERITQRAIDQIEKAKYH